MRRRCLLLVISGALVSQCSCTTKVTHVDFSTAKSAYAKHDFSTALEGMRPAAEQGNVEAQTILGRMYETAEGVTQNYAESLKWYRLAAQRQSDYAEYWIGKCYDEGHGVPKDAAAALKWYKLASAHGNANASLAVAAKFYNGDGVPKDCQQAVTFWLLSTKQHAAAKKSGTPFRDAIPLDVGQTNAEIVFLRGEGFPDNSVEAQKWLEVGAEEGLAAAQLRLGTVYHDNKNYPAALKWLQKAANRQEFRGPKTIISMAQYVLATMHYNGEGVTKNYAEAAKWLRLSAGQGFEKITGEEGFAKAQYQLGVMYINGRGVLQDYSEAIRCYRLAAEQGDVDAQAALGAVYFVGKGTPQDYVQAHLWFNLAAVGGNEDAVKLRTGVERRMTPQQVAEAQRLAREWKPKQDDKGWSIIE